MKTIDMLGQPCPIPVIQAKKALAQGTGGVKVLVDNIVAVQNLEKMAKGLGYSFDYTQQSADCFAVAIEGDGQAVQNSTPQALPKKQKADHGQGSTVLITGAEMGRGAEELGKILIKGFIFSLGELPVLPRCIVFLNGGVHHVVEGANTVPDLQKMQQQGVKILACGTCLNYYGLTEKLAVGSVTDMFGITTELDSAAHLISL